MFMATKKVKAQTSADGSVVLENDALKVTISPVGARIVSLWDKAQKREDVKILPYAGGINTVRFGRALNLDDWADRDALTLSKLPDGSQKLVAVASVQATEDKPGV